MTPSRFLAIPRFALPYTLSDGAAGLRSIVGQTPPPAFDLLGDSPKFWTRSGRQALWLLLTALDLKPQSGVALPLFTDPSLVSAIVAAGHRPIFIDIEPRYLTMDPKSLLAARGRFAAVIVVHLFGQMADLPALMLASGGKLLIEDAAHAPLSFLNGSMAGSFGSASFYSFASTKYWPAGGGGLAVIHDAMLAQKFARVASALSPPSHARELLYLILQSAKAAVFNRRLYGLVGKPLRRWAEQWALLEPTLDLSAIPRPYAVVACRQALRFRQRVRAQRANSLRLLAEVGDVRNVVLPTERPGARYNYHLFPVVLQSSAERDAVRKAMWDKFVDTSTIYSDVVKQCRLFGYRGDCPVAEAVAERLITIPNYAALRSRDIDRVAQVFRSSLRACRKTQPARRFEQTDVLDVIGA